MGIFYVVGVGPGDPELLTLKAVKVLRSVDVIACPAEGKEPGGAFRIAVQAVPEIIAKERLLLDFPMRKGDLAAAHKKAAQRIRECLRTGKSLAFLTLGDPGIYSTFSYIADELSADAEEIRIISGIPSFCAAAAQLRIPILQGEEAAVITAGEVLDFAGTQIIMKAGSRLASLKREIETSGRKVFLVENCGMESQRLYNGTAAMPEESGYFSILIVK